MFIVEDEFNFYKFFYDGCWFIWGFFDNFIGFVFFIVGCIEYSRVYIFLKLMDICFIVWMFEFEIICYFFWDVLFFVFLDKDSLFLKWFEIMEIKIN